MPRVTSSFPLILLALWSFAPVAPAAIAVLAPSSVGALAQEAQDTPEAAPAKGRRGRRSERASKGAGKTPATPPGMQHATPVAIFGDWNVFSSGQGKTRLCYAIAQPQTRSPKTLARDSAYFFVTVRKAENVQNEVAVMLGFPSKPSAAQAKPGAPYKPTDPTLSLGATRYGLVVKDGNAWLQNPADEPKVVAEMGARNPKMTITTTSMRGNPTSDEYALAGFAEAMKRTRKECE